MERDLGFLSWEDPLAGLEDPKSELFRSTCHRENKWHADLIKEPHIQQFIKKSQNFKDYLNKNRTIKKYFRSGDFKFDVDAIDGDFKLHLPGLKDPIDVEDFVASPDGHYIGIVVDNSEGQETLTLQVYKITKTNSILQWQHEDVGGSIAFIGDRIAYTIGKSLHIHNELILASPTNKSDRKKLFKVLTTESMSIIQTKFSTFLHVTDYIHSKVYKVSKDGLEVIHNIGLQDHIIGGTDIIYHDSASQTYKSVAGIPLPPPSERPLWYSAKHGLVQTISDGVQKIWSVAPGSKPKVMLSTQVPGRIQVDPFADAIDAPYLRFVMRCVDREPLLGTISGKEVRIGKAANDMYFPRLQITKITATSADGEKVPGIIVKPKGTPPTNLLVYCYGSYGHPTPFTAVYQVYWPLLETGRWALAFCMARGGGDRSYEWIHAGRKLNRKHTVDDYEAIIQAAQEELHIGPSKTALYGRSAGGIPVGMMIARHPRGTLAAAAWMEAPFVDVLRTMTDMSQPLTVLELEEFGNPAVGPAEFYKIAQQSPINNLPDNGVTMKVILRTGENDRQVYAYEPVKFAQRLRGKKTSADVSGTKDPAGIYLFCGKKEGHFYSDDTAFNARIQDMAALDFWLSGLQ